MAQIESLRTYRVYRYLLAPAFLAIALVFTLVTSQLFPYPFLFLFFWAVMASAWFGGMGVGLFAVGCSALIISYFFFQPLHSFAVSRAEIAYFISFAACSLLASWVSASRRRSEEALREAKDQLEIRVSERTAELSRSNIELQEGERQLRLLTEAIPQQIWAASANGLIEYCNHQLLEYTGGTIDEMRGDFFQRTLHPEDREGFRHKWEEALSSQQRMEGQWRVAGADGSYRWFLIRSVPWKDGAGKVLRWYGTNTDIEDSRRAEEALKTTQAELTHLTRVLSMGELTASIAHEINQPLTGVVTNAQACIEWLSTDPINVDRAKHSAALIVEDGARAGMVVSRIRALFRKQPTSQVAVDLNGLITELQMFLSEELSKQGILMTLELSSSLPIVFGDRVQLQQVLLNLVRNAIDAMEQTSGKKELIMKSARDGKDGILISVEDFGVGLAPELVDRIFDPFFSTKPDGIGVGLSISRSIIEAHDGRLWASPKIDGGAIFQFKLPCAPGTS